MKVATAGSKPPTEVEFPDPTNPELEECIESVLEAKLDVGRHRYATQPHWTVTNSF